MNKNDFASLISPSSGIVIVSMNENRRSLLRIFISPFHSHRVLTPIASRVRTISSKTGWRLPAFLPTAIKYNTFVSCDLVSIYSGGQVRVTVYSGLLTNSICACVQEHEILECKSNLIRIEFGSMVEIVGDYSIESGIKQGRWCARGSVIGIMNV